MPWPASSKIALRKSRARGIAAALVLLCLGSGTLSAQEISFINLALSMAEDGQYRVHGNLRLQDPSQLFRYLERGELTRASFELIALDQAGSRETTILGLERSARYDAFLGRYILSEYPAAHEAQIFTDREAFLKHWSLLPSWNFARDMIPSTAAEIRVRGRLEYYELDHALWIISPFIRDRVLDFEGAFPPGLLAGSREEG